MQIETRKVYDILVVDMIGKLDTTTSGDASDRMVAIAQGEDKQIILNLEQLEYVSSAGLQVILRTSKLLQARRGELKICSANGVVKEVLELSGFNSLLKLYASEKDAVAAFST
ncbi:MAG: STAS domain-containing protein [Thiohalocapsa sp.]